MFVSNRGLRVRSMAIIAIFTVGGFMSPAYADTQVGRDASGIRHVSKDSRPAADNAVNAWRERFRKNRETYLSKIRERRERVALAAVSERGERDNRSFFRIDRGRASESGNRTVRFFGRDGERPGRVTFQRSKKQTVQRKGPYGNLIAKYAAQHGVPFALARAVVQVESTFRPNVTGGAGEIGLMQIKLSTARGMGYKGTRKQLYDPATNLYWGMKYLGKAHQLAGGSTCGTILRYNAGHYAKSMNPVSSRYCGKVKRILA